MPKAVVHFLEQLDHFVDQQCAFVSITRRLNLLLDFPHFQIESLIIARIWAVEYRGTVEHRAEL